MSYCVHCGGHYSGPEQFCNKCGQRLGETQVMIDVNLMYAAAGQNSATAKDMMVDALREARSEEKEERRKARNYSRAMSDSDDSLELYLKCIAVLGIFHGMSLIGANFWPILNGPVGSMLVSVAILSGLLKIVIDVKHGQSIGKSLLIVTAAGVMIYGVEYEIFWYLKNEVMAHPGSWFPLTLPHTTPTPLIKIK